MSDSLVCARGLEKAFAVSTSWRLPWRANRARAQVRAVDGVDLDIAAGQTLALVGESGCGKTTVGRMMVGLASPDAGEVRFDGDVLGAAHRRRVQMVFQDPYASLNPRWRVDAIVAEPLRTAGLVSGRQAATDRVAALLSSVGLAPDDAKRYPHQFSGGQRQRISIARALASNPEFIVCDEPTSALDVSVQAQVLNLMQDLQQARGLTYLFISHNLAVVRHVADVVGVMYMGRIVERAPKRVLFARPRHPYTQMLIHAIPDPSIVRPPGVPPVGELPDPLTPPVGCAFHPRCPHADARCRQERPALRLADEGVEVACHAVEEGRL